MKNQSSMADELKKLKQLLDEEIITKEEFDAQKQKLLDGNTDTDQNLSNPTQPQQPIIINNTNTNVNTVGRIRRKRSALLDITLIFCTGGLWIIWMILRPKYY